MTTDTSTDSFKSNYRYKNERLQLLDRYVQNDIYVDSSLKHTSVSSSTNSFEFGLIPRRFDVLKLCYYIFTVG